MTPDQCPELNRPSKHSNDILKLSVRMWLFESNTNNCKHVYEKLINPFLSGKVLASSSPAENGDASIGAPASLRMWLVLWECLCCLQGIDTGT
jgi:hypothetical protein